MSIRKGTNGRERRACSRSVSNMAGNLGRFQGIVTREKTRPEASTFQQQTPRPELDHPRGGNRRQRLAVAAETQVVDRVLGVPLQPAALRQLDEVEEVNFSGRVLV